MTRLLFSVCLIVGVLWAPAGLAQRFDTDWWVSIHGRDSGAAKLVFGPLIDGGFDVIGEDSFGATQRCGILEDISGTLAVDFRGEVSGTLFVDSEDCTVLVIVSGKPNQAGTRLKLRGELDPGGEFVRIQINGEHFDTPEDLTGQDQSAVVSGRRMRSKAYDLLVEEGLEHGFPEFDFTGAGPVEIDGEESPIPLQGRFVIDPKSKVFGVCADCDFGFGPVTGSLRRVEQTVAPGDEDEEPTTVTKTRATLFFDPEEERRFRIKARLAEETTGGGPLRTISVDPTELLFPDTAVDPNTTSALSFEVSNTGTSAFSGQALVTSGGLDYVLLSDDPSAGGRPAGSIDYTLAENDRQTIYVRFQPTVAGTRPGTITLTGGGDTTVSLTGQGTEATP
jgi:hypothetical protein